MARPKPRSVSRVPAATPGAPSVPIRLLIVIALGWALLALAPQAAQAAPSIGEVAVVAVDGPGDCLRLRSNPGLNSTRLDCIPHGSHVTVTSEALAADGLNWRLVDWARADGSTESGWVSDEYLRTPGAVIAPPASGPAAAIGCATAATRGGLGGPVVPGSTTINTWSGGTVEGIETAALAGGCSPASVWANRDSGGFVGYLFGAPDFVNQRWFDQFPGGRLQPGMPLLLVCDDAASQSNTRTSALRVGPATAPAPRPDGVTAPAVQARAAVVIDDASGAVLYDRDAHASLAPASLTKIATAILTLNGADPSTWVRTEVGAGDLPPDSSLMGLRRGDCFQVRDLLYGLMLPSGNDAALALARYQAGSDAAFVRQMNTLAAQLGLAETSFIDPHGLGGDGHATSAYDLARLTRYAMTLPDFREIVGSGSWTARGERTLSLWNVNRFLGSYPGADGVKTGFTSEAGRTLVASAVRDGRRIYVVLLNSTDRVGEATALFDWAFDHHTWSGG